MNITYTTYLKSYFFPLISLDPIWSFYFCIQKSKNLILHVEHEGSMDIAATWALVWTPAYAFAN